MAHDLEAGQRLRELLAEPAWELPAWPDPAGRVRAAARRQRLRAASLATGTAAVTAAVAVTALTALRPASPPVPPAVSTAYALPAANAAGFPAGVYPRGALGPLLHRGGRCPDPAGVQDPPATVRAKTTAVVRHLGASFESDLHSSDPANWQNVLASWRSGSVSSGPAGPELYSGPLGSWPAATGLTRAVRVSCGNRIAAGTWLVVTGQPGRPAQQSQYLLLDRRGHLLVWHSA